MDPSLSLQTQSQESFMEHTISHDLERAQDEVSASSAGGAPFLIAYGLTLFVTAILYFFLPIQVVALVAMFQGSLALPLAFWLERRLGAGPISPDNPLRPLSVQMAMSQILALPAVIGWI
jgi:predicted PurR-regulated permease PerM